MADETNQVKQHHHVEKPNKPRKTAVVKTWNKTGSNYNGELHSNKVDSLAREAQIEGSNALEWRVLKY